MSREKDRTGVIWKPEPPGRDELDAGRTHRDSRNELFLRYGLSRDDMTRFVVDSAEPLPDRVLDIGTGKGFTAIELARRGADVTTIDLSENELRTAFLNAVIAGVADRIEFRLADGGDLPFDDGSFEVVTMVNVLHHLENAGAVLPEIARVLGNGGRLVVSDFTDHGFDILEKIHRDEGRSHDRHGGETIDRFASLLDGAGMSCTGGDRRFHQHVIVAEKI
jgi:ubiquinone/menaquinone biosynthesis C-methylase UbiE